MEFKIPLRDINEEITVYSLVDKDDYEKVNKFKWHLTLGYANGKNGGLHRFIMNAKKDDPLIDHINGNRLDNRKVNLRFSTRSQNSQNKPKKEGCTSKYIGVSQHKKNNTWLCRIRYKDIKENFSFDIEEHAAYWYDQLAIKYYGTCAKVNDIQKPENFVEPKEKIRLLPKGINLFKNKYKVRIQKDGKRITLGIFTTLEEAINSLNKYNKVEYENNEEIKRNNEGIAILKTKNCDILVDDNKYHELNKYSWNIVGKYFQTDMNNRNIMIHRYLLNAQENEIIDHINHNTLDNRLHNLRKSNSSFNNHNKTKQKDTLTKYIGIYITKSGKYQAQICKNKVKYALGTFKTEEEAVKVRDLKAIELYGSYAKLNI